jgi:hypothetical protein
MALRRHLGEDQCGVAPKDSHTRRSQSPTERSHENRAQLRLALEDEPAGGESLPLRRGRRIGWIEDALSPLGGRMPKRELRRLIYGIGATLGIEALVWLTDMGGLSREEAVEVMRSNARTLLRSALERIE